MKGTSLLSRSSRSLLLRRSSSLRPNLRPTTYAGTALVARPSQQHRLFNNTPARPLGLSPSASTGKTPAPDAADSSKANAVPASISDSEYKELADSYMDKLVLAFEEKAETVSEGLEIEYAAGVLTITSPKGTYVLNKQPPNKQIWLSSPISGPKRYDWVVSGSGQHEKEGSELDAGGKWIYLRDGSALGDLLRKELDVDVVEGAGPAE